MGGVGALLLAFMLYACSNDLNALYKRAPKGSDGADASVHGTLPILPALPDPDVRSACEACAKDKCQTARDNCLEDDGCTEILACKGKCSDPACWQDCEARYGLSNQFGVSSSAGAWYDDYAGCVFRRSCSLECKASENFGCVGKYDWPSTKASHFSVRLQFGGGIGAGGTRTGSLLVGAEVRACSPGSPCTGSTPIDTRSVDPMNGATLNLSVVGLDPFFRGSFEVEDARIGPFGWHVRILPIPLTQPTELAVSPVPPDWLQSVTNGELDLEADAPLVIMVGDCIGSPARGVRVTLPDLAEVPVLHFGDGLAVSEAPMTTTGVALVTDIPEGVRGSAIRVQAIQVGTERVVAERDVDVRAGWITQLWWLTPSAR